MKKAKRPNKTKNGWINLIKNTKFISIVGIIIISYIVIIVIFGLAYYFIELKEPIYDILTKSTTYYTIFDSIYFSSVTFFTVGYGDISLTRVLGKLLVQLEMIISSITVAVSIAILTAKLFYPGKTIIFSDKIIFNNKLNNISFRIINIHRAALINPEIRVYFTRHCVGNVVAASTGIAHITDIAMLGIHDFTCTVNLDELATVFFSDLSRAQQFNRDLKIGEVDSRFRVTVAVSGHNGIQQICETHKYYPNNFYEGNMFKAIEYNNHDQSKMINLSYKHFGEFWSDFERIV